MASLTRDRSQPGWVYPEFRRRRKPALLPAISNWCATLASRVHFGRLSSARAAELIARAQAEGLPVTADVAAHHLHLTEIDLVGFDSQCHVQPPLRGLRDKDALRAGVGRRALLGAICSDHQPHEPDAKQAPFGDTEPGISGLDTLLALSLRLVARRCAVRCPAALERLTWGPARILGLDRGHLGVGAHGRCLHLRSGCGLAVELPTPMRSRGQNSPFIGWELQGPGGTRPCWKGGVCLRDASANRTENPRQTLLEGRSVFAGR
jgi:dihydroorotase